MEAATQAGPIAEVQHPDPRGGSYLAAVLLPGVGLILAIIAFARNKVGPGLGLALTSWFALAVWTVVILVTIAASASNGT